MGSVSRFSVLFAIGVVHGSTNMLETASQYRAAAKSHLNQWDFLNSTLGGRLERGMPVSTPCFPVVDGKKVTVNSTACAAVQEGYTNPLFRAPLFGAYMLVSSLSLLTFAVSDVSFDPSLSGKVANPRHSNAFLTPPIRQMLRLGQTSHVRKAQSRLTTSVVPTDSPCH